MKSELKIIESDGKRRVIITIDSLSEGDVLAVSTNHCNNESEQKFKELLVDSINSIKPIA